MERVIDRKEYRRSNEKEKIIEDEQIDIIQNKIKKILLQSLGVSILLLIISFLKFYNCIEILNKIDVALNTEITISSLQKSGQRIYEVASNYYMQLDNFVGKIFNNENDANDILFGDGKDNVNMLNNSGENIINSGENILKSGENISADNSNLNNVTSGDNNPLNNNFPNNSLSNNNVSLNSNSVQYESAVEGINQMSEDANYIKENYKLTVPVIGTITSEFGVRNSTNPIVSAYHLGLDIAANTGTQILAAIDGEVIEAATDTYYGKYLKIKKDDIVMTYAHCSKLLVKTGDKVTKGKLIAYVGNTGNSTGPHLHIEIKYKDRLVNPTDVLEF